MLRSRISYLTVFLCATLFFICFNGYVSLYVFALSLALPLVSLLLSLPGMVTSRMELFLGGQPDGIDLGGAVARTGKGEVIPLRVSVRNASPFPAGKVKARLTVRNTLTGEEHRERLVFTPGREPQILEHALSSPCCGMVECRLTRAWACDLLGLFAFPLRGKGETQCTAFFYPAVHTSHMTVREGFAPDAEGERYSPFKPGDDPSELFGLREYREGDRLSRVHWKLSQKTGQTLVRELSFPLSSHFLFLLDLDGEGEEADTLLDVFATCSSFLANREIPHRVGYRERKTGGLQMLEIAGLEDACPALETILASGGRAPLPPFSGDELPRGISHALYLCCDPKPAFLGTLRSRYPSARLSVVQVSGVLGTRRETLPEAQLAGAELTVVKPGKAAEALHGFSL